MNRRELLKTTAALPLLAGTTAGAADAAGPVRSASPRDSSFDPWLELNTANLRHNVSEVRRRVANRPILAVIKNNGYGAGVREIAQALETVNGIAGLAVIKLQEAMALRDTGIRKPILLMGPFDTADLDEMVARDVMAMMYQPMGREISRVAQKRGKPVRMHFCVDTGIGRVGVPFREAEALLSNLGARSDVAVEGVQTTLTEDPEFEPEQLRRLDAVCKAMEKRGIRLGRKHAASSFALFQRPEAFLDMVRPGMALFGCYSEPAFRGLNLMNLRPVVALKTRVVYVKQLQAGESAGYERVYKTSAPVWLATLPVGHADGLPRGLVKGGSVRIGNRRYPIVGAVSSSHCLIEIGAQKTVEIGDEATLFDWQEGSRPEDLAVATSGSVYDLLMHLNPLLPHRLVVT